ncbi:MAG: hypothetical protein LBL13_08260 [Bacteroidales bacterium]|nr:hypothetical protein [Bacteroidales bacterium]
MDEKNKAAGKPRRAKGRKGERKGTMNKATGRQAKKQHADDADLKDFRR